MFISWRLLYSRAKHAGHARQAKEVEKAELFGKCIAPVSFLLGRWRWKG